MNDRGSPERYFTRLEGLVDALIALSGDGEFGDVFARHTTNPMAMHRPVVFDLSAVDGMDNRLQAGLQLVCWSYGSAAVAAAKYLSEGGLAPGRKCLMVMDELWRALRAATFMVDRVDDVTRLNRTLNQAWTLARAGWERDQRSQSADTSRWDDLPMKAKTPLYWAAYDTEEARRVPSHGSTPTPSPTTQATQATASIATTRRRDKRVRRGWRVRRRWCCPGRGSGG